MEVPLDFDPNARNVDNGFAEFLKERINALEDELNILREVNETPQRDRLFSNAITELERAQNWLIRYALMNGYEVLQDVEDSLE